MKKYLFLLLLLLLLPLNVFAYHNDNTTYTIPMVDYDDIIDDYTCGTENVKDFLNNLINNYNYSSGVADFLILTPDDSNRITIYAYLKDGNQNRADIHTTSYQGSNKYYIGYKYKSSTAHTATLTITLNSCSTNLSETTIYSKFLDFINNGTWSSGTTTDSNGNGAVRFASSSYVNLEIPTNNVFNNNGSYEFYNIWFYYSTRALQYKAINDDNYANSDVAFYKNLYIETNETTYYYLDTIPTFWDLKDYFDYGNSFSPVDFATSLDTIYTNLPVSSVSSYTNTIKFKLPYVDTTDYLSNISFNPICSGRVDNTNYYSYETFNCSISSTTSINNNEITITFNNLTYSQNLTSYDKIYVTINPIFLSSDFDRTITDLSSTYNLGDLFVTSYKGNIFDTFSNLPLGFKALFSSNLSNPSSIYVYHYTKNNYGIRYYGYSSTSFQPTSVVGKSILRNISSETPVSTINNDLPFKWYNFDISNSTDRTLMVLQDTKGQGFIQRYPSLKTIFNDDIILSFNNTIGSDTFYSIDSTGNIVSNNYKVDFLINGVNSNDDYDLTYYVGIVNNFINGMSDDIGEFSHYTQLIYNGLPQIFQLFIFVLFILSNIYMIFILIRK